MIVDDNDFVRTSRVLLDSLKEELVVPELIVNGDDDAEHVTRFPPLPSKPPPQDFAIEARIEPPIDSRSPSTRRTDPWLHDSRMRTAELLQYRIIVELKCVLQEPASLFRRWSVSMVT